MTINLIGAGAGVGRTGTYSLKLAINQIGLGPCHHMEEVLLGMSVHVPFWSAAADNPDWPRIYDDYKSAVDWPTACFYRELLEQFPDVKFELTERDPERWADSFGATIYKLLAGKESLVGAGGYRPDGLYNCADEIDTAVLVTCHERHLAESSPELLNA